MFGTIATVLGPGIFRPEDDRNTVRKRPARPLQALLHGCRRAPSPIQYAVEQPVDSRAEKKRESFVPSNFYRVQTAFRRCQNRAQYNALGFRVDQTQRYFQIGRAACRATGY